MTYLSKTNRRNTTSVSNAILQFHLLIYFAKREKNSPPRWRPNNSPHTLLTRSEIFLQKTFTRLYKIKLSNKTIRKRKQTINRILSTITFHINLLSCSWFRHHQEKSKFQLFRKFSIFLVYLALPISWEFLLPQFLSHY